MEDAPSVPPRPLSFAQAVALGAIEGLTEYLPVSSTGHLLLAQRFMGIGHAGEGKAAADAYAICIQFGAILAVAGLYFPRLCAVALGLLGRNPAGLKLGCHLAIAFAPAAVVGVLLEPAIKRYLFGGAWGLWPIVAAWFLGGLAIFGLDAYLKRRGSTAGAPMEKIRWRMALAIGLVQCLAMWPGVSRSLATIAGGVLAGLSLPAAVEFSFLLGFVTLSASTLLDAVQHGELIVRLYGWITPIVGLLTATVAAALAVRWLVAYLQKRPLALFGWYRVALALAVTGWLLFRGP